MSTSETDSDSEPVLTTDTVSSLTAFAHLSATQMGQPDSTGQWTVSRAMDTLATLDFRLVCKDTALHGLVQNCASTIIVLLDALLQQGLTIDGSYGYISDIASIMKPSCLHLLFQYRRLFRIIATGDFKSGSAPLAVVCWVDVVLAKLGDVATLIAAGDDPGPLPESLKTQREEDNLLAATQLPDNWDMLPPMLLSERASTTAKRLSIKLMLGTYILRPSLLGHDGVDNTIRQLLSTFAEFVRQGAARVDGLGPSLGPASRYLLQQERLISAVAVSLFAAADTAQDSTIDPEHLAPFRPQTMAAAMRLLRFILNLGERTTQTNAWSPSDHLDIPACVIIRWKIVPHWTWSLWPEYSNLYADTIRCLTTTYIQHYSASSVSLLNVSDLMPTANGGSSGQSAVISVMIDLVLHSISMHPAGAYSKQLSTGKMGILRGSCRLISQWIKGDSYGIQRSKECCKALIILFGHISQNEQHVALNELVIECLTHMRSQCTREAWRAAAEDNNFCLLAALEQSFIETKMALSRDDLPRFREICVAQMMQFLAVMMSRGVQPLDPDRFVDLMEAVAERVVEMPPNDREFLCETLIICLATANLSKTEFPFSKDSIATDEEAIWHLGMGRGCVNLFLASAFSLYIITSGLVSVEPLTYLEGLEHLLDTALLICSRHYPHEDEPLALIVLPMICDALTHLLEHGDEATGVCMSANARTLTLGSVLRSLNSGEDEDSTRDRYGALLRHRFSLTVGRVLREMGDGMRDTGKVREYELLFCRRDYGVSRMLYIRGA